MDTPSVTVPRWTGTEADLLRIALRESQKEYAARVGVAQRTVAKWGARGSGIVLSVELQTALDRELALLTAHDPSVVGRFGALLTQGTDGPARIGAARDGSRLQQPGNARIPVSGAEIAAIRTMLTSLTSADHAFGGGYARTAGAGYLEGIVRPRLTASGPEDLRQELAAAAAELAMRVAWMYLDVGDGPCAREGAREAFSLAQQSRDLGVCAWTMAMTSLLETWLGDGRAAVAYGHAATGLAATGPGLVRAFAYGKLARALAAAGDAGAAQRALATARSDFEACESARDERVTEPIRDCYDGIYVLDEEAHCWRDTGWDRRAIELSEQSLALRGTDRFARSRAFAIGTRAVSLARLGEVEHACASAADLVELAAELASQRVRERLGAVRSALAPYRGARAVAELDELARAAGLDLALQRA